MSAITNLHFRHTKSERGPLLQRKLSQKCVFTGAASVYISLI
jgi:hypothetical protein